ncbi:hypothetical protein EVAR_19946_1 [Eumeta japonica]|uniref:Uncharacterized protein n=1 Tax=Eumeta variegata TaxID=151549 RepID=A0A4C1YLM6_EUMVA|nr:hypothetical protein EVAR_19946_1 [Eumeta japonica]
MRRRPVGVRPAAADRRGPLIRHGTIVTAQVESSALNLHLVLTLKSFMKKGKKEQSSTQDKPSMTVNGESSPVQFRRSLQSSSPSTAAAMAAERNTLSSPERYVYGGSVTPLPRSRFQERLRSPSQYEVNSLRVGVFDRASASPRLDTASLASDVTGSRLSVESTNPFDEGPVPPVRASRRKKKRAPPPPPSADTSINTTLNSTTSEKDSSSINTEKNKASTDPELEIEDSSLNIELKIVEDEDHKEDQKQTSLTTIDKEIKSDDTSKLTIETENSVELRTKEDEKPKSVAVVDQNQSHKNYDDDNDVKFAKVDIKAYRRNSSFNEDDIRLRRGNLEDFNITANKRSKSLSNTNDSIIDTTYDINLNTTEEETDVNCNEPRKVVCKLFNETSRKQSIDNSISSTEKEFIEIDKATRELEREINKLNSALNEDEPVPHNVRLSVSEIKRRFDNTDTSSPNPIPKPRRSNFASPVNGNVNT